MIDQAGIGMTSQRTRDRLIERLREQGIRDMRVLSVMREVPPSSAIRRRGIIPGLPGRRACFRLAASRTRARGSGGCGGRGH